MNLRLTASFTAGTPFAVRELLLSAYAHGHWGNLTMPNHHQPDWVR
jgi:hypothetical protein